jgi:electron-transferring-flavoprotein dehydrogenase
MKSGMMAAETAYAALHPDKEVEITKNSLDQPLEGAAQEAVDMSPYETAFKESWVYKELNEVRNLRPSFHNPLGLWGGMAYSGVDSLILKGRTPWTLRNTWEDHAATKKASECKKIDYPLPDGKLSFDILTSVSLTGTNHAEDQPVHLRLPKDEGARARHTETNVNGEPDLTERLARVCG